ncbi:MAG: DNA polymerase III, subunit gamma and tau [Deltaproteobacteria bacterium RIFCSPLOWO2_12_FULL_60_19]|nr:MAG: DNA polymerase III, subunit gamma and tau [Deltaproteobacteria bacterium RIFCSPLOWO2_12_FULL_60_19]
MSYQVIARKWRPQCFDEIVGQGHITRVLRNAIRGGRIAHAYLFTGVRGVGKTTAARILAKALNCEKGPTAEPCGECVQCVEIKQGNSIDVYEIDGASNRGIDEVRQIIENVRYQPAKSRFKIYIIDEVHQVTRDAFNALLKTLEEPPPFVKFILATTEPQRLPDTILSRCQRFDFRRIAVREIVERLKKIAEAESLQITDGALLLLAREAEGSMRDAQSLLEQLLAYAGSEGESEVGKAAIDERRLEELLGIAERRALYEISHAVIQRDAKRCVELVAEVMNQGRDVTRLSRDLVEHFRNLLMVRLIQDRAAGSEERGHLLDLSDQEIEELGQQGSALSVDALLDYFKFMAQGDEDTARSAYPRFALEATLIRLATLPETMPVEEALERLEALERKLGGGAAPRSAPAAEKPPPVVKAASETRLSGHGQAATPAPAATVAGESSQTWKRFVAFVTKERRMLAVHLEQAQLLSLAPGQMRLGVEEGHQLKYLQDGEQLSALKEFACRFFSVETAVSLTAVPARSRQSEVENLNVSKAPKVEEGNMTDLEREAMRIFGGSMIQVKKEQ